MTIKKRTETFLDNIGAKTQEQLNLEHHICVIRWSIRYDILELRKLIGDIEVDVFLSSMLTKPF